MYFERLIPKKLISPSFLFFISAVAFRKKNSIAEKRDTLVELEAKGFFKRKRGEKNGKEPLI